MSFVTLHPGHEATVSADGAAKRVSTLAGVRVGLLDNNKKSVGTFLQMVDEILTTQFAVASVTRVTKSNASVPVPDDVIQQLRDIDVLITGIGD